MTSMKKINICQYFFDYFPVFFCFSLQIKLYKPVHQDNITLVIFLSIFSSNFIPFVPRFFLIKLPNYLSTFDDSALSYTEYQLLFTGVPSSLLNIINNLAMVSKFFSCLKPPKGANLSSYVK